MLPTTFLMHLNCEHSEGVPLELRVPDSVRIGKSVALLCSLSEGRSASFAWSKDGLLLREDDRIEILNSRKTSTLSIEDVRATDRGRYSCVVNVQGVENTAMAFLSVEGSYYT